MHVNREFQENVSFVNHGTYFIDWFLTNFNNHQMYYTLHKN